MSPLVRFTHHFYYYMIYIQDELLDIVNNHDVVVGTQLRTEVYQKKSHHFRAINAFIINDQGQLWIPRRVATKVLFPLALDSSVGGHVQSGESYDQAFERELHEELRLTMNDVDCRVRAYLTPSQHNVAAFMMVYEIRTNEVPLYNQEDFCEYFWLSPEELIEKIEAGEPAKSDLIKLVKLLYT